MNLKQIKCGQSLQVGEDFKQNTPQDIILTAIYVAEKRDRNRSLLTNWCQELCNWSQEKIRILKKEVAELEMASDIGSRSVVQLADIYKLMFVLRT